MTIVKKDGSVTFEFDHNTGDKVYLQGISITGIHTNPSQKDDQRKMDGNT